MKKTIMVTILQKNTDPFIIIFPISCSVRDALHIKNKIEANKNDPRFLLAIMTRYLSADKIQLFMSKLKEIENAITNCDILSAEFVDIKEILQKAKEAIKKTKILHLCLN